MKWELTLPKSGDMIRVKAGSIYHYGVYASDDEVIQFGLAPNMRAAVPDREVKVCTSDIDTFLGGGFLEVAVFDRKERRRIRKPKDALAFARGRIGEGGYNILYNNCEHFAYEAVTGEKKCTQADDVRAFFRNLPIVDVYLAPLPDAPPTEPLGFPARDAEIAGCTNERVKREKYYAWRLLMHAASRSLNLELGACAPKKSDSGKWTADKFYFSISHTEGLIAVAVSRAEVGIDVERIDEKFLRLQDKVLTAKEREVLLSLDEGERGGYLIARWTEKESIYKRRGEGSFLPSAIECGEHSTRCERLAPPYGDVYLSVATDTPERIRIFKDIRL